MSFQDFQLDARVFSGIPPEYTSPTPIQTQAIPAVLAGKDVLGLAQTGTGKTAAFVLPILHHLLNKPLARPGRVTPRALIIAPTRELAQQINDCIIQLGKDTGLTSCTIYGGVNMQGQVKKLQRGIDIVVACPGRLLDHMSRHSVDFSALQTLVLDEADQMFDMGFLPDLRRIIKKLPLQRQNLLFSATMPKEVSHLTHEILRDPVTVKVGHDAPVSTIAHALYPIDQGRKVDLVLHLLKGMDMQSVLIFTRTKHRAKRLWTTLQRAGYKTTCLQGNLSQGRRLEAMAGFRDGSYQVLVATDIAARGIDVQSVSHVINFDIPDTVAAYTHRIGRTGRAARNGDAFTFVSREDESQVRAIERSLGTKIERRKVDLPSESLKLAEAPRQERPARNDRRPSRERPSSRDGGSSYRPRSSDNFQSAERAYSRPHRENRGDSSFSERAPRGSGTYGDRRGAHADRSPTNRNSAERGSSDSVSSSRANRSGNRTGGWRSHTSQASSSQSSDQGRPWRNNSPRHKRPYGRTGTQGQSNGSYGHGQSSSEISSHATGGYNSRPPQRSKRFQRPRRQFPRSSGQA